MKRAILMCVMMALVGWGWGQGPGPEFSYYGDMQLAPGMPIPNGSGGWKRIQQQGKPFSVAEWKYNGAGGGTIWVEQLDPSAYYWFIITVPRQVVTNGFSADFTYPVPSHQTIQAYRDLELRLIGSNGEELRFIDDYSSKWSNGLDTLAILGFWPQQYGSSSIGVEVLSCGMPIDGTEVPFDLYVAKKMDSVGFDNDGGPVLRVLRDRDDPGLPNSHSSAWDLSYKDVPEVVDPYPIELDPAKFICHFEDNASSYIDPDSSNQVFYFDDNGFAIKQAGCGSTRGLPSDLMSKGLHNIRMYWFHPLESGYYSIALDYWDHPMELVVFWDSTFVLDSTFLSAIPGENVQDDLVGDRVMEVCLDIAVGLRMIGASFSRRVSSNSSGESTNVEVFPCFQPGGYYFRADRMYYIVVSGPVSGYPIPLSDKFHYSLEAKYCPCISDSGNRTIPLPPDHPKGYDTYAWAPMPADPYQSRRLKINANIQGELQVYRCKDPGDYGTYELLSTRKVMPYTRNQSIDILNASACEGLRILVAYKGDAVVQLDLEAESLDPPPEPQARRKAR